MTINPFHSDGCHFDVCMNLLEQHFVKVENSDIKKHLSKILIGVKLYKSYIRNVLYDCYIMLYAIHIDTILKLSILYFKGVTGRNFYITEALRMNILPWPS